MKRISLLCAAVLWCVTNVHAEIKGEAVEYHHGDAVLEGYLAYDDAVPGLQPGILVVHEWKGLNDYAKRRAEQLAQLGYVAFAADMYGKGIRAKDHTEAAQLSGVYRNDRQLMRARAQAAFDVLTRQPNVDPTKLAAMGYCFGGMTVLELARSGADLLGVVTFHGGLDTPHLEDARNIKGKLLVLHGAEDRFVTQEQVKAFQAEMDAAAVRYQLIQYPGAVHSFTVPEAGSDTSTGMAYNAAADQQSWEAMKIFFSQLFEQPPAASAHQISEGTHQAGNRTI